MVNLIFNFVLLIAVGLLLKSLGLMIIGILIFLAERISKVNQ